MNRKMIHFLPGPAEMFPGVSEAFLDLPYSHRSDRFRMELMELKQQLCLLTKSKHVEILSGSGTLANDVIACQLKNLNEKGIILSNGEFGNRLIRQATNLGVNFSEFHAKPGEEFNFKNLKTEIQKQKNIRWIWLVHCETSTGILNDLKKIEELAEESDCKICVDCISSIGNLELDLSKVYLASASGNKGLAAFPGTALVFYREKPLPSTENIPLYLDLNNYIEKDGIPFTLSTHSFTALNRALTYIDEDHFEEIEMLSAFLLNQLKQSGFRIVGEKQKRNPAVFTIELPSNISSIEFGNFLLKNRIYIGFESEHLRKRNWIQIALMGNHDREEVETLIRVMEKLAVDFRVPV